MAAVFYFCACVYIDVLLPFLYEERKRLYEVRQHTRWTNSTSELYFVVGFHILFDLHLYPGAGIIISILFKHAAAGNVMY